jgi:hypothetical protein
MPIYCRQVYPPVVGLADEFQMQKHSSGFKPHKKEEKQKKWG